MSLVNFKLYLITDRNACNGTPLESKIKEALAAGIRAVQLREKDLSDRKLLGLANRVRDLTLEKSASFFINDRIDLVKIVEADGVHLPEEGLSPAMTRPHLANKWIGKSVHSREAALQAEADGADFITFSPIFDTESKRGILEPRGLAELARVASAVRIPVFALGGITPERAAACVKHGAHGVAVISSILKSPDIRKTAQEFRAVLGEL